MVLWLLVSTLTLFDYSPLTSLIKEGLSPT
uniref:Uncharacterized protein n=1 Tax=Anguilla anguilla TaxID=7936 RepID=A0A0E9QUI3_ANGAN